MSCRNGSFPIAVTLRLEAARLALQAKPDDFGALAGEVFAFVTEGVDLSALDAPPEPIAMGDSAEAVTSRNALMNAALSQVGGLPPKIVAVLRTSGVHSLGALVQADPGRLESLVLDVPMCEAGTLVEQLGLYGLRLGMSQDQVREWIVKGPKS
ncbi:hypothetical protein D7Y53_00990 [Stenotrophomonas maltophilia]|uniref:hypothetical protein n=1 Tax=Stenotrophomonas maltophilia TaxID=40324 RepID=UPI0015DE0E6B|nr:hypothetical protein [Stenotrophomonas maltophilia]MBA0428523.1 hypothetical protein [Stenotrophomonas maltophilia]